MTDAPLAERMRPSKLEDFIGQEHITKTVLETALEAGQLPSMILWGPPGVGKTTLANIIASEMKRPFYVLSAINSGVKDIRAVIDKASRSDLFQQRTVLFIDEIHRFSKSQQDSLLGAVEKGQVTLIGATTENPSFEVIPALLSRCQVYVLEPLTKKQLQILLERALAEDPLLNKSKVELKETTALMHLSGGDARKLLNILELVVGHLPGTEKVITDKVVYKLVQQKPALYDKTGEQHYNIISAFIKSMRGSDPNGAVYWLARMLEGGEDPVFIARRMVIFASEDIGVANPTALVLASTAFQAVTQIGMPEGRIILSQAAVYLATSVKSNASYMAINEAIAKVKETGDLPVPLHIRNAPTNLMKDLGYGGEYKYSHSYEGNFREQEYLPGEISGTCFYEPGENERERGIRQKLREWWGKKYGY